MFVTIENHLPKVDLLFKTQPTTVASVLLPHHLLLYNVLYNEPNHSNICTFINAKFTPMLVTYLSYLNTSGINLFLHKYSHSTNRGKEVKLIFVVVFNISPLDKYRTKYSRLLFILYYCYYYYKFVRSQN